MINKKLITLTLLALLFVALYSCKKEDTNLDITSNLWKVVKIKKQNNSSYDKTDNNYILQFKEITYTINLDVNECGGNYEFYDDDEINIEMASCTEMCCDSKFADDLIHVLAKTSKYHKKDNNLILEGQGKIVLEAFQ